MNYLHGTFRKFRRLALSITALSRGGRISGERIGTRVGRVLVEGVNAPKDVLGRESREDSFRKRNYNCRELARIKGIELHSLDEINEILNEIQRVFRLSSNGMVSNKYRVFHTI